MLPTEQSEVLSDFGLFFFEFKGVYARFKNRSKAVNLKKGYHFRGLAEKNIRLAEFRFSMSEKP